MTWSYGLLEEEVEIDGKKEKVLILSEIFFVNKSYGACYLNWKDLKKSVVEEKTTPKVLSEDIRSQIENKYFFKVGKNKILLSRN